MDPTSYPVSHINPKKSLKNLDHGELELSPNSNTILHLVSQFGDIDYVKDILQKHTSLIYRRNHEGETPAYIASREGHVDVLEIMINCFKRNNNDMEPLLTRSIDNQTALHIAIQNHHTGVVFWLIKEVPLLANRINDYNESPLYHAAERRYHAILRLLLRTCRNVSFQGPNDKTALHAAAISGSPECIEDLLSVRADLLYDQDKHGWTPLHYAIDHNNSLATAALLHKDCSIGYEIVVRKEGINTAPIHMAASQDHSQTMEVLISKCPGCLEISHRKGRNILHFAIENKKMEVIKFIFGDPLLTSLINKKDDDGNTPIHLLMASNIEMMEIALDSRVDINTLNHEGQTPLDMISSEAKRKELLQKITVDASLLNNQSKSNELDAYQVKAIQRQENLYKELVEKYYKMNDNLVLVAALIATATFAAGFTLPGGLDSNVGTKHAGMPILIRKSAFQAFVIFNSIAFVSSCCVLFGHFRLQIYLEDERIDKQKVESIRTQMVVMFLYTALAMITMTFAFILGIYVVVTHFLSLAIFLSMVCVFVMSFRSVFPVILLDSLPLLGAKLVQCV